MALPSVNVTVNTTGIAVVPPNTSNVPLVLGTSSGGTYGTLTSVAGQASSVQAALGNGPLPDKAALDLVAGAPAALCWRMFSGSLGSTTLTGTGTGTVTFSGNPVAPYGTGMTGTGPIVQTTVSSGSSTPGQFSVSLDGGNTYSASQIIPVGLVYLIPNTGITATFSPSNEGSGVWVAADTYVAPITAFAGVMHGIGQSGFTLLQVGPAGTTASRQGEGTFTNNSGNPIDDFQVIIQIVTSGVIGVAQYVVSFDGGNTFSPVTNLSAASTNLGFGVLVTAANTGGPGGSTSGFVAGDVYSFQTTGPRFTSTDVANVMQILTANPLQWGWLEVLGKATSIANMASMNTTLQAQLLGWWENDRFTNLAFQDAPPNSAQSSINAALIAEASALIPGVSQTQPCISIGAGDLALVSPITGFQMNRGAAWAASARCCSAPLGQDLADVGAGPLVGVTQLYYNDATTGGVLDAVQYTTARTINGIAGFFLSNGNVFAPASSDLDKVEYARVINQASYLAYQALVQYLNSSVRVVSGGTIDPRDAKNIQNNVAQKILAGLGGQISGLSIVVDATHSILLDGVLPVAIGITPLGYAREINVTIGFSNSALSALAA